MAHIVSSTPQTVSLIAGTGGTTKGHIAVLSAGTAVKAAAAAADATVLGIFNETVTAGELVSIDLLNNTMAMCDYTGSSKTSLADADIGKVFDLTDSDTVNLDDTTGGICVCMGYNNTTKQIVFRIPAAKLYF